MSNDFARYTEASANALAYNPKSQEVIERKQEILKSIALHHKSAPQSILFYGFSALMLGNSASQIYVTAINDNIKNKLDAIGVKYTYIKESDLAGYAKKFDWVIATDEYFTFAADEQEQLDKIKILTMLARSLIVTTLRDYKNQDFKDREFSQPLAVRNGKNSKVFVEFHDYDFADKNVWKTLVYEMLGSESNMYGPFERRSMFFKQLAKFSIDAGAKDFYVHKNLMYKSLIKKNYEHVISISF